MLTHRSQFISSRLAGHHLGCSQPVAGGEGADDPDLVCPRNLEGPEYADVLDDDGPGENGNVASSSHYFVVAGIKSVIS